MKKLLTFFTSFGILAAFVLAPTFAENKTIIVTPSQLEGSKAQALINDKWFFYNDENDTVDNSLGSFVSGPATPPEGDDSIQISVSGTQRRNIATYQFKNIELDDITTLKFSTYNPSAGNGGSTNRSGYLNFNVDFKGDDTWQRRLVYLPSDNGTIQQNVWQEWDAINGGNAKWRYSGSVWPNTSTPGSTPKTWNQILEEYPGVKTRSTDSWLGIRVGEPYADGYIENIDAFKFGTLAGTTTFDFERFYPTTGVITNPANNGDHVTGVVNFTATYDDGDEEADDAVQWAVRQGDSCTTGTVAGNVDGYSNASSWNGSAFSATLDTSNWTPGEYCFVFNPTDDAGENDVRVTRTFFVDADPYAVPPACQVPGVTYGTPIIGTNGTDNIKGTSGNDLIFALGGSDKVDGKGGHDCIVGGDGSDKLLGGSGNDVILGGNGSDSISGDTGNDYLYGENGSDSLSGGTGEDHLYGGADSDSLKGDSDNDVLDGQEGIDSAKGGSGNNDACSAESVKQCEA